LIRSAQLDQHQALLEAIAILFDLSQRLGSALRAD
jgi:hypothetical protein